MDGGEMVKEEKFMERRNMVKREKRMWSVVAWVVIVGV